MGVERHDRGIKCGQPPPPHQPDRIWFPFPDGRLTCCKQYPSFIARPPSQSRTDPRTLHEIEKKIRRINTPPPSLRVFFFRKGSVCVCPSSPRFLTVSFPPNFHLMGDEVRQSWGRCKDPMSAQKGRGRGRGARGAPRGPLRTQQSARGRAMRALRYDLIISAYLHAH